MLQVIEACQAWGSIWTVSGGLLTRPTVSCDTIQCNRGSYNDAVDEKYIRGRVLLAPLNRSGGVWWYNAIEPP